MPPCLRETHRTVLSTQGGSHPSQGDPTQGDPISIQGGSHPSQGGPPPSQPVNDANAGNSQSSTGWNGNGGNQGNTNSRGGPQGPTPDRDLNKIVFVYSTVGGPLEHWGIKGRIQAGSVFHLTGPDDDMRLHSRSMLVRSDFVDRITRNYHFVYQQNNRGRV